MFWGPATISEAEVSDYTHLASAGGLSGVVNCVHLVNLDTASLSFTLPSNPAVGDTSGWYVGARASSAYKLITNTGVNGQVAGYSKYNGYCVNDYSVFQWTGEKWILLSSRKQPHAVQVYQGTAVTLLASTWTPVPFTATDFDVVGLYSPADTGVKIKKDGAYLVSVYVSVGNIEDTKELMSRLLKNGVSILEDNKQSSGSGQILSTTPSIQLDLVENDVLTLQAFTSSTSSRTTRTNAYDRTRLAVMEVANNA
jgi:hypothetical protein